MKPQTKIIISLVLIILPSLIILTLNFLGIFLESIYNNILMFSSLIGILIGLQYILAKSDFRSTIYQRLFYVGYSILFLGALAKLQHWAWTGLFIIVGVSLLAVTYSIRFFLKTKKELSDYLKLLFLISFLLGRLMKLQHYNYNELVSLFSIVVFIFLLLIYYHKENQLDQLKKQTDDFLY